MGFFCCSQPPTPHRLGPFKIVNLSDHEALYLTPTKVKVGYCLGGGDGTFLVCTEPASSNNKIILSVLNYLKGKCDILKRLLLFGKKKKVCRKPDQDSSFCILYI